MCLTFLFSWIAQLTSLVICIYCFEKFRTITIQILHEMEPFRQRSFNCLDLSARNKIKNRIMSWHIYKWVYSYMGIQRCLRTSAVIVVAKRVNNPQEQLCIKWTASLHALSIALYFIIQFHWKMLLKLNVCIIFSLSPSRQRIDSVKGSCNNKFKVPMPAL